MTKKISDLINIDPQYDREITGLSLDSLFLEEKNIFLACQGTKMHGKIYLETAIEKKVAAVFLEEQGDIFLKNNIPCIPYPELSKDIGKIAAKFYDFPTQNMHIIGITGTNGKTSTSHFIAQHLPQPCGLIGTLGYGIYGELNNGKHTTPNALDLQKIFNSLYIKNSRHIVMEVSSHGIQQHRVANINFEIGIFTNLTRDHLDYHGTMEKYGATKAKLFQDYGLKTAVINIDDSFGKQLLSSIPLKTKLLTYSLTNAHANIYCNEIIALPNGYQLDISTPLGNITTEIKLIGDFNVSNILAATATFIALNTPLKNIKEFLFETRPVIGRMELFHATNNAPMIVDYAHTPDALKNALQASRKHCKGKLWCIFGCGGERDQGKRPIMGQIAETYADHIILTDDNPRHESPEQIIKDILSGFQKQTHQVIQHRVSAISYALENSNKDDLILIAGKGHETYQQIGDEISYYSDRETAKQLLGL
ncbi:MAG: hypothetical protein RIT27_2153 [Pseudomonadota bacterium]|jgi:UDP-N-acetylmuramoyl-L-alanyl-D-glutamate--2,6-diaminopimelate ligase